MASNCRSCAAPVHWALTPDGKKNPIDYNSVGAAGNVLLLSPSKLGGQLLAVTLSGDALELARRQDPPYLFVSHWATCPQRAEWREKTDARKEAESAVASD